MSAKRIETRSVSKPKIRCHIHRSTTPSFTRKETIGKGNNMLEQGTILIVEDEEIYCDYYKGMLTDKKYNGRAYDIEIAMDLKTASEKLRELSPDIVLLDLRYPPRHEPEEGLAFLKEIKAFNPTIKVIVVTGASDEEIALTAVELGAYDFVKKDTNSYMELPFRVNQAYEKLRLEIELRQSKQEQISQVGGYMFAPGQMLVGTSEEMKALYRKIDQVAKTDSTILILGESGTGKELVAKAIHHQSQRRNQPMITVNCGAIPAELMESELFGYKKGAFTGATSDKKGLFAEASNGTLFLDEIGELPLLLQVKLLRALQSGEIRRVGDNRPIQVNCRYIASSNRRLKQAVKDRTFREDLYFRLNVVPLEVPPLRERRADIPTLAEYFLHAKAAKNGKSEAIFGFREDAINYLMNNSWQGNVRELEYVIERAVLFDEDGWISVADMKVDSQKSSHALPDMLVNYERNLILEALKECNWTKTQAAILLGVHEATLRSKMKRLRISENGCSGRVVSGT